MPEPIALPHVEQRREILTPEPGGIVATTAWIPANPRAIVVFSHGHAEHSGRYPLFVNTMVSLGFAVFTLDHRGHGRSSGTRALAMRFDDYVDDLGGVLDRATAQFPELPVILFGHSMGGLIAIRLAEARPERIRLLITSGPALIIDEGVPPLVTSVLSRISRIAPTLPVPRGGDEDTLSTDPAIRDGFMIDHRTWHGSTRIRTASEMIRAGRDARQKFARLTMPLLAMHGAIDTLTSPRGTEALYAGAATSDKTIVLWPGMKHEILNEPGRAEVIRTIVDWIVERLPETSSSR